MIPQIIHYCWFGRNPLPQSAKDCIASWKKYCPDYEIVEWNEDNFSIDAAPLYVRQAYASRKWAFVTDYVRLYALTRFGGVYMDTDVEVIKPLDEFLTKRAFSGFEDETSVPTGIMACEKGFPLFESLLRYYDTAEFPDTGEKQKKETNVVIITNALLEKGLLRNNQYQEIEGFALYPKDYFCPKSYYDGQIHLTSNTHTIHHFSSSWLPEATKNQMNERWNYFERKKGSRLYRLIHRNLNEEELIQSIRLAWVRKMRRKEKLHDIIHAPFRLLRKLIGDEKFEAMKKRIRR